MTAKKMAEPEDDDREEGNQEEDEMMRRIGVRLQAPAAAGAAAGLPLAAVLGGLG